MRALGPMSLVMAACGLAGCGGPRAAERDPFVVLGGDEADDKGAGPPAAAALPVLSDARFGFRWELAPGWSPADARQALPALASFEGGAALAVRDDRSAQALLLAVDAEPRGLDELESQARRKASGQQLAVQAVERATVAAHPAIVLRGREGGRDSAHVELIMFHTGGRRFELQCRRNASAESVCDAAYGGLAISP